MHICPRARDRRQHVVNINAGAHSPLPRRKRSDIGDHPRFNAAGWFWPQIGVEPGAIAGDADNLIHNGGSFAVDLACPVLIDAFGLTRADQRVAIIVVDEKLPLIPVDHCGQDLRHLGFCRLVIRGCVAINKVEPVARLCHVIAQFSLFGLDKLCLKGCDLALGQRAGL